MRASARMSTLISLSALSCTRGQADAVGPVKEQRMLARPRGSARPAPGGEAPAARPPHTRTLVPPGDVRGLAGLWSAPERNDAPENEVHARPLSGGDVHVHVSTPSRSAPTPALGGRQPPPLAQPCPWSVSPPQPGWLSLSGPPRPLALRQPASATRAGRVVPSSWHRQGPSLPGRAARPPATGSTPVPGSGWAVSTGAEDSLRGAREFVRTGAAYGRALSVAWFEGGGGAQGEQPLPQTDQESRPPAPSQPAGKDHAPSVSTCPRLWVARSSL